MKYKVRGVLKKKKVAKQTKYTLYVAITVNGGTPSLISVQENVNPKVWQPKAEVVTGHPMADDINKKLLATKKGVSDLILKYVNSGRPTSASAIKAEYQSSDLVNIFDFSEAYRKRMKNKRDSATLENVRKHMAKLEEYHGSRNLNFHDINADYLEKYEEKLFDEKYEHNYVQLLIRSVRRMFTEAKKKKVIDFYPFEEYEMLEYKPPEKQFPDAKELVRLKKYQTDDIVLKQTQVWFIFGCHSGLRISDWHRFNKDPDKFVKNGRLVLGPKKKSTGFVSMPIGNELEEAIRMCKEYPLTIEEATLNEKIKIIAKDKAVGIKKHLTAHSARHHFAVIQCLDKGISSETAAELMGITLETFVKNYSVVTEEKIDLETKRAWKIKKQK